MDNGGNPCSLSDYVGILQIRMAWHYLEDLLAVVEEEE